jgi:hypothetical protein
MQGNASNKSYVQGGQVARRGRCNDDDDDDDDEDESVLFNALLGTGIAALFLVAGIFGAFMYMSNKSRVAGGKKVPNSADAEMTPVDLFHTETKIVPIFAKHDHLPPVLIHFKSCVQGSNVRFETGYALHADKWRS